MHFLSAAACLLAGATVSLGRYIEISELRATYDYIVVGAGTAGAAVASRLSEANATVLLIEAGGLDKGEEMVVVPRQAGYAMGSIYDWNYTTVAMPTMANRTIGIPAGKLVGGSSVLNGMAFDRGAAADYNAWAELGNPGWTHAELMPFFKKHEKFTPPDEALAKQFNITWDPANHGFDGPIHSSFPVVFSVMTGLVQKAFELLGVGKEVDGHGGRALNFFWSPNSLHATNKSRSYSRNYVELAIERENFHVLLYQQATKLITEKTETSVRITGVEFAANAQAARTVAKVTKEVVLSGGVLGSPRLLQVSGIGPSKVLQSVNVSVVVDLPGVGTNYQDHAYFSTTGNLVAPPVEAIPAVDADTARKMWYETKTGPWTISGPTSFGFIPLPKITNKSESILGSLSTQAAETYLPTGSHPTVIAGYNAQKKLLEKYLATDTMGAVEFIGGGRSFAISNQHPFSRGYMQIKSSNPFEYPLIDLRYHTNPLDFSITSEAIRFTRTVMATSVMAPLGYSELLPGPAATSDDALATFVSTRLSTMFHSCCTNPMQPLELGGVVDSKLKVYGVANLRVADNSILPLIPGTHLQSTAYAIGEKVADMIKSAA